MNRVNLIPIHRRRAKARRARVRMWTAVTSAYAIALLIAGAVVYLTLAPTMQRSPKDMAAISGKLERSNQELAGVRTALAEAQQTMASAQAIFDQPDWSVLFAVVSEALGDSVVLNHCDLTAAKEEQALPPSVQTISLPAKPVAAATARAATRVVLRVSGLGRSQAAVATFILQLENTDLFERVNLLQSSRQQLMSGEAIAFDLDCPLKGRIGGAP